jgi:flagellar basal body-associated protein FliL
MTGNKKTLSIIIALVVAAVLIVGGLFVYNKYYKAPTLTKEEPTTLGGQIYEQVQNPAEKIPEINPYSAKTNPFEEAKTNPFEEIYKNPFE